MDSDSDPDLNICEEDDDAIKNDEDTWSSSGITETKQEVETNSDDQYNETGEEYENNCSGHCCCDVDSSSG